ncbi:unnamed protein product [Heterobilharzia americana]|nr:unnamed protein product [Heterobilharzia americana]
MNMTLILQIMLKLVIFISLILEEEVKSSKRLQIYFPLTWTKVRKNFGIPISVKYISLSQMYYWTSDWSNEKSWKYLYMANYEPPLYIKEGYWIPDSFKTICSPEATYKSFLDMIYEFTQEDYDKRYSNSLRNYFTRTGKYYDGGYLNILSFLVNICQCLRQREPRDPCLETQGLCGQHYCYRDPSNLKLGYRCACPFGFKAISSTKPQCVNINECIEYSDEVCLNGGICIDKEPSSVVSLGLTEPNLGYICLCRDGYSGSRCERRISLIEWTTWSAWTECSVKCGIGFHTRFRSCPLPNHCTGSHIQTGRCQGPVFQCYDENDEEIPELSQSGWKILKSWGIEWHPDDGHSLNDAFYWNEADDDWGSLHYTHPGTVNLFDILEWTQALQLTRKWTIRELLVFHSIILAVLFTPLCLIVFGLAKMIQRVLYAKRIRLRR